MPGGCVCLSWGRGWAEGGAGSWGRNVGIQGAGELWSRTDKYCDAPGFQKRI